MAWYNSPLNWAKNSWSAMKAAPGFYGGGQIMGAGKHLGVGGAHLGAGIGNIFNPAGNNRPHFRNAFNRGKSALGAAGGFLTASNLKGTGGYRGRAVAARAGIVGGAAWGIQSLMRNR
jgi:hypothetical protein